MGLFDKLADVAEDVGTGIFSKALKPAGKGVARGIAWYDRRIMDPLMAFAVQQAAAQRSRTFDIDPIALVRGDDPIIRTREIEGDRRNVFGRRIEPRKIDLQTAMFGGGKERERAYRNIDATKEEVGLLGEMLTKTIVDPFNIFLAPGLITKPIRVGARLALGGRAARGATEVRAGLAPGGRTAAIGLLEDSMSSPADDTIAAIARQSGKPLEDLNVPLREITADIPTLMDDIMAQETRTARLLSTRPFRPFRFITNRFFGPANTVKANAPDARVSLEAAKAESFQIGMDELGAVIDGRMEAFGWGGAKLWDDEVRLASGQKARIGELFESPGKFKLSPDERALVQGPKALRQAAYDHVKEMLIDHYTRVDRMTFREAVAKAAKVLPETPLDEGVDYWPRVQSAIGGEPVSLGSPEFLRGGRTPNINLPRMALEPSEIVQFHGKPGVIVSQYTRQLFHKLQMETVIEPWRKAQGLARSALIPAEMQAAVDQAFFRRNWLKSAGALLAKSKGLSGKEIQARVAKLVSADVPEEWKAIIRRLETGEIIGAPTPRELAQRGRVAAGEAARAFEPSQPHARLSKAAEAAIAAERGKAGATALRKQMALVREELVALGRTNADELARTQQNMKAVKRGAVAGMRPLREAVRRHLGGSTDELFENTVARQMEKAVERLDFENMPGFLRAVNDFSGISVGIMAGTTEFGHGLLQMVNHLGRAPHLWALTMIRGLSNKAYLNRLAVLQRMKDRAGRPLFQTLQGADLRLISEPTMPDIVVRGAGLSRKIARLVSKWPVNRHFTRAVNLARLENSRMDVSLLEKIYGRALTAAEYRTVARTNSLITGDLNWTASGFGLTQRALERGGLRFAATWLRSNLGVLVTAMQPSVGLEANLARVHLATVIGTLSGIYAGTALAMGQTPNFDIMDPQGFMSLRIPGTSTRVRPGGIFIGLMRTVGRAAVLAEKAAHGDKQAARELVDIRQGRNPLRQYWRGGAPVIGGLIYDMTAREGQLAFTGGRRLRFPDSPEALQESAEALGLSVAPFTISSAISEGPTGAISTFLGASAVPINPPELFLDLADRKAGELGFRRWEDVPKATQADIVRKDDDLREALEAKEAFYAKFPDRQSQEDFVFAEIENSRRAMEDPLLASWGAVEAGTLSMVEFRQRFSDLSGKHAFLASRLMDGLDVELRRRNRETEQDYYARLFHGVQPEQFDVDRDGNISPLEWDAWREKRSQFWLEFPQAQQFRSYIEVEYPTRQWKSPVMAEVHRTKLRMQDTYQTFLEIPKYQGLSAEAGNFIDSAISLADRKVREIKFALAERGIDPNKVRIPTRVAWRMVLEGMQSAQLTPEQMEWLRIAVLLDLRSGLRRKLLSSERARFLMENRELTEWYPSAFGDAGLRDREIALLGLAPTALGASVQERVASLTTG